jgi:hypothetical protein
MSEVQYSEDGHWWWDEAAQQWQPVAAAESASSEEVAPAATAAEGGGVASLSDTEIASYFEQALDAGVSDVYEA